MASHVDDTWASLLLVLLLIPAASRPLLLLISAQSSAQKAPCLEYAGPRLAAPPCGPSGLKATGAGPVDSLESSTPHQQPEPSWRTQAALIPIQVTLVTWHLEGTELSPPCDQNHIPPRG